MGKSVLTLDDIQAISGLIIKEVDRINENNDKRFNQFDKAVGQRLKVFQIANETSHELLINKMCGMEKGLKLVQGKQDIVNGRVFKHELVLYGNKELKEVGLIQNHNEMRRYRFIYKNPWVVISIIIFACFMFIDESRSFILNNLKIIKFFK